LPIVGIMVISLIELDSRYLYRSFIEEVNSISTFY